MLMEGSLQITNMGSRTPFLALQCCAACASLRVECCEELEDKKPEARKKLKDTHDRCGWTPHSANYSAPGS